MLFNNNNPISLQRELEGVSRALGRNDISTYFSGDGAYATTDHIVLPHMPITAQLDDDEMRVFRGYHIHEVGHIVYTDDERWERACKSYDRAGKGWKKHALNALEDVMIENRINEAYAGAKRNIEATVQSVLATTNEQIAEERALGIPRTTAEFPHIALQMGRNRMGYSTPSLNEYLANVALHFPEALKVLDPFVDELMEARSTDDCAKLCNKLEKLMNKHQDTMQQQPDDNPDGEPDGDGDGQQYDGDGDGDATGEGDGKRPRKAQTSSNANGNDEGDGDGQGGAQADEEGDGEKSQEGNSSRGTAQGTFDPPLTAELNKAVESIAQRTVKDEQDNPTMPDNWCLNYQGANLDEIIDVYDREGFASRKWRGIAAENWDEQVVQPRKDRYNACRAALSADVRKKQGELSRVLMSQENEWWVGGKEHGRLDPTRMVGVTIGERNIFAEKRLDITKSTSVLIMLDTSSSMDFWASRDAIVLLNECLARANIQYAIIGWNSGRLQIIKDYKEKPRSNETVMRIGGIGDYSGGTMPVPAILSGYRYMIENNDAARKIMLFTSDAEFDSQEAEAIETLGRMMPNDVESYGLLIGGGLRTMQRAFPSGCVQCDFKNLGDSLIGQLASLLVKKASNVAA